MQRMYIGPTIPGIVKKGTVFVGDLPKSLTDKAKEISSINNLVVSIHEVTSATKALCERGSIENVSYSRIESILNRGI